MSLNLRKSLPKKIHSDANTKYNTNKKAMIPKDLKFIEYLI